MEKYNSSEESSEFDPARWRYRAEGEDHFIYSYIGYKPAYKGKLLILEKIINCSIIDRSTNTQINKHYSSMLYGIPELRQYLLQKIEICPINRQTALECLYKQATASRPTDRKLASINPNTPFLITNDLFYLDEGVCMEIKPKSRLVDQYHSSVIKVVADKFQNITPQDIQNLLQNSPAEQKLKWFKKSCGGSSIQKNKLSPVDLFECRGVNFKTNTLIYKENGDCSQLSSQKIDSIINSQLRKCGLMSTIQSLQKCYLKSFSFFSTIPEKTVADCLMQGDETIKGCFDRIRQKVKGIMESKHQYKITQLNEECLGNDLAEEFLSMLVAATWRDISLIIRVSIGEDSSQKCEIKIIDYDLKSVSKYQDITKKEQEFLENYVRYKLKSQK